MTDTSREDIYQQAFEAVSHKDVRVCGMPALFTSCCRNQADAFTALNPYYSLIHHSDAGAALEDLDLFAHMPAKLAYMHWYYLSARYIAENDFTDETVFIGNPDNPSSTAFGLEIPMLFHAKNVQTLYNPLNNTRIARNDWMAANLMRPYLLAMVNTWSHGPQKLEDANALTLFKKLAENPDGIPTTTDPLERRTEIALKLMLCGHMAAYGKFPTDQTQKLRIH